jgi:hypothetical protein
VEVRVPNGLSQRDVLSLEVPMGDIGIEVKHRGDGAWVCGTDAPVDSRPFEVAMTGEFPDLRLTTCWSLWTPGGAGESDLNAVIDALLARGWIRVSD